MITNVIIIQHNKAIYIVITYYYIPLRMRRSHAATIQQYVALLRAFC